MDQELLFGISCCPQVPKYDRVASCLQQLQRKTVVCIRAGFGDRCRQCVPQHSFTVQKNSMDIRFVAREDIDKIKWNSCVHYAINGNVFGYLWYLDAAAQQWDALVEGDYESVMPLPWRRHWWHGKVLHQPELIRQTDIYSIHVLSASRLEAFWRAVQRHCHKGYLITDGQSAAPQLAKKQPSFRRNQQLGLIDSYELMRENYDARVLEQLTQARDAELHPNNNLKPERIAALYQRMQGRGRKANWRFHAIQRLMYQALHRGWGFPAGVEDPSGELLAADFFIFTHDKLMSLAACRHPANRHAAAAQCTLYDYQLRLHAGKPIMLDFNTQQAADVARAKELGAFSAVDLWKWQR